MTASVSSPRHGVEFVNLPDLQRMYIVDIGGPPHSVRMIFMRMPHRIQRTLSPATTGIPHRPMGRATHSWSIRSDSTKNSGWIHARARHTRRNCISPSDSRVRISSTLKYEFTIDDPGAYTATLVERHLSEKWSAGQELIRNTFARITTLPPNLAVEEAQATSIDRRSVIVP